jgi:pyruvate ferredoxin oxidoreductase alpha subunit
MSFEVMVGNKATATAVKLARVQVASAFPVTPQTTITEYLSEMVANGELDAEFVNVEGELSSQVVVQAASRVGARVFVCTSGPGQLYMHHPMHQTSDNRLPVVMATVHRGNKGMQPDHTDLMSQLWTGWIQLYVEHNQEALDTVLMAYKVAEDSRVRLPIAVGYDGYVLSYTAEPVEIPEQEIVDAWLPPNKPIPSILPDEADPSTYGRGRGQSDPQQRWKDHHDAVVNSKDVIIEVNQSFRETFGRGYGNGLIEKYKMDGAEAVIVAMGSIVGTCRASVDKLWEDGKKVGLVKLKCFLPFPTENFQEIGNSVGAIGVIDRNVCLGHGGAAYTQVRNAVFDLENRPSVLEFFAGLGGKEVRVDEVYNIGEITLEAARSNGVKSHVEWVGI